jgi:hypothetical protein
MLDINVLLMKSALVWTSVRRAGRRWWRIIPFTTGDEQKRAWRKSVFRESIRHEWRFIACSSYFDWFVSKSKRRRRYASRMFWRMNHPHSGTRQLADAYVSHVGISSGR